MFKGTFLLLKFVILVNCCGYKYFLKDRGRMCIFFGGRDVEGEFIIGGGYSS